MTTEGYIHGHDESVLRSHRWRTAENSAAYLLPVLRPDMAVLDVGCGPATLTVDLARRVRRVVGVDQAAGVLDEARAAVADAGDDVDVELRPADVYALPFDDGSFDVAHAHQVLQHLADPVAALREMRRVVAPGGVVAVRDADYAAMTWWPAVPALDEWLDLYHRVARANGHEPDAGRRLRSWALAAGFAAEELAVTADVWCFTTPEERRWWGGLWADRCTRSTLATQALERGIAEVADLERLAEGWRTWADADDGWFAVLHGEVLARV